MVEDRWGNVWQIAARGYERPARRCICDAIAGPSQPARTAPGHGAGHRGYDASSWAPGGDRWDPRRRHQAGAFPDSGLVATRLMEKPALPLNPGVRIRGLTKSSRRKGHACSHVEMTPRTDPVDNFF